MTKQAANSSPATHQSTLEPDDDLTGLAEGEYVLLRGGYGGGAKWVWGGILGFMFLMLVIVSVVMLIKGTAREADYISMAVILPLLAVAALIPWLRSGRFRLTNQRLSWNPVLGTTREMPLSSITRITEVNPSSGAIHLLLHDGDKVKMRNLGGWKKLWSGLLLYRAPGMDAPLPPVAGQVSYLACRTTRQQGRTGLHNGTLVFRPHAAWFLPDTAVVNMLAEALGGMFKGQHTVQPVLPTMEYVERLGRASDEDFDARLEQLCEQLKGQRVVPGEATLTRKKMMLRPSHDVIRVSSPTGVLQKGVPRAQIDALGWFDSWLQA